jgi:metallo-beta-lactamase class B
MFASLAIAAAVAGSGPATMAEWHAACDGKEEWTDPGPPLHIYGNVYHVGSCTISSILITSPKGHVLLDSGMTGTAPAVAANIERLGFKLRDIRLIGASHEHNDHSGAIADLQTLTGAAVMAMPSAFNALETGQVEKEDPQSGIHQAYPGSTVGIILFDGQPLRAGPIPITAYATPGHAPGSTSWTWRSCEAKRCIQIVYADSISAVSADSYRFSDHDDYVADFRRSLRAIGRMKCDLLITPHPGASNFIERMDGKEPLIGPGQCQEYAARGAAALDARLAKEKAAKQ